MSRQLVLVALVAMVALVGLHSSLQHGLVHAFPHGFECGTGHSHVHADADIAKVSQSYHTAEHEQVQEAERRRLQDQVYHLGANSQFLPLSIAKQSNLAGPIRIKVLWDVVEGGDYTGSRSGSNARQCTAVGTSRPYCRMIAGLQVCQNTHPAHNLAAHPSAQAKPSLQAAGTRRRHAWSLG